MWTIYKFVSKAMAKLQNTKNIRTDLITYLAQYIAACPTFCCTSVQTANKHNERVVIVLLWKFFSPILNGYAYKQTDLQTNTPVVGKNKVVNRKYNTHSK